MGSATYAGHFSPLSAAGTSPRTRGLFFYEPILLRGEPDGDHVAVRHHVVAPLEPQRATVAGAGIPAGVDQPHGPRLRRGRSRAGCRSGSGPAACHTDRPCRRCQDCAGSSSPAVKNAISSSSENAPRTTRLEPGVARQPSSSRIAAASGVELGELGVQPRPDATAPAPGRARIGTRPGPRSEPSSTLATNKTGLEVSGCNSVIAPARRRAPARCEPAGPPAAPRSARPARPPRRSRAGRPPWRLRDALEPPLGLLEVGVDQSVSIVSNGEAGRRGPRGHRRSGRCGHGRRGRSRRSRGCSRGTGCRAPRPGGRRRPARRCRGTRSCRGRPSRPGSSRPRSRWSATGTTAMFGSIVVNG